MCAGLKDPISLISRTAPSLAATRPITAGRPGRSTTARIIEPSRDHWCGAHVAWRLDQQTRAAAICADDIEIAAAVGVVVDGRSRAVGRQHAHRCVALALIGANAERPIIAGDTDRRSPRRRILPPCPRRNVRRRLGLVNGHTPTGGSMRLVVRSAGAASPDGRSEPPAPSRESNEMTPATPMAAAATAAAASHRRRVAAGCARLLVDSTAPRAASISPAVWKRCAGTAAERLLDGVDERRGHVGSQVAETRALAAGVGLADLVQRLPGYWIAPGDQVEEQRAESVDVGAADRPSRPVNSSGAMYSGVPVMSMAAVRTRRRRLDRRRSPSAPRGRPLRA